MNDPLSQFKRQFVVGGTAMRKEQGKQTRPDTYHNQFLLDPTAVSTDEDESPCLVKASGSVKKALRYRRTVRRKE